MFWFTLPEVAVIVAVYVPTGVPGVVWDDDELPPPHPTDDARTSTTIGAARAGSRLRFRSSSHPEPSHITVQVSGITPRRRSTRDTVPMVTGAVVPTVTVTGCAPLPVSCTEELDKLQTGAGVASAMMPQLRLTVPLNDPNGATTKLNLALCPALTVSETGDPEAGLNAKSEED
jgi:hypothetical protein